MYRQGDLLFVEAEIHGKTQKRGNALVTSRLSGHSHVAHGCEVVETETGEIFLTTCKDAEIRHEKDGRIAEHAPIALPADKTYKVIVQQQYDYFGQKWERTID